jgi:hypothetical protein
VKRYRGEIKVILPLVFKDFPDAYVVNGQSWIGNPKLQPWCHVTYPLGKVYTSPCSRPTGVVLDQQQFDQMEMLYYGSFNSRIRYVLDVYDRHSNPDVPNTNY